MFWDAPSTGGGKAVGAGVGESIGEGEVKGDGDSSAGAEISTDSTSKTYVLVDSIIMASCGLASWAVTRVVMSVAVLSGGTLMVAVMMTEPAATLMFTYSSLTPAELAKLVRSSDVTDSV